ncbi:hypothetical protein OIV83_000205 [Microbotryomycetes sp. JL201]|nr:hypothetical protein OIV83_000205 [Microbotryomycetes sp. JL201]
MLHQPSEALMDLLDRVPPITIRLMDRRSVSVERKHEYRRREGRRDGPARDRAIDTPRQAPRRRRQASTSSSESSGSNENLGDDHCGQARALTWSVRHLATAAGPVVAQRARVRRAPPSASSCWPAHDNVDSDDLVSAIIGDDDDEDDLQAPSPLPSLSPSRPRLFPDSDADEDEFEDEEEDDPSDEATTPNSVTATTPPSLSSAPWSAKRSVPRKAAPAFDPLLSPPPATPVLSTLKTTSRRASAGWLPAGVTTSTPSLPTVVSIADDSPFLPTTRHVSPSPPPARTPTVSLLTKSLRSLARLPNLSLSPAMTATSTGFDSLDLDGLGPIDDRWTLSTAPPRKSFGTSPRPVIAVSDMVRAPSVQLKTFNSPARAARPEPVKLDVVNCDTETPLLAVIDTSIAAPVVVPTPLPTPPPRFISNQRHLLMLSLEISMMHANKIRSPLRPRAVVIRRDGSTVAATALTAKHDRSKSATGGSALRWEVKV